MKSNVHPVGYWQEWAHVERVLRPIIRKSGRFPTRTYLEENGEGAIVAGIDRYQGGMQKVAERMGYEAGKQKNGHWMNKANVVSTLKELMEEHHLTGIPSNNQLCTWGYSSVGAAIMKHHGGFQALRAELGQEQLRTQYGSRGDLEKGIAEAKECMREHHLTTLPRMQVLIKLGYGSLAAAITGHYGGMRKFRGLLGQESPIVESGSWKDLTFTLREARKIKGEHNLTELPSKNELQRMGYSSFSQAIYHYHGGFTAFRLQLGEKSGRAETERLKDERYALQKVRNLIKKQKWGTLPTDRQLCDAGYGQIAHAIEKYQGGFSAFRKKLGEKVKKRNKLGSLQDKELVKRKIEALMKKKKVDRMPSAYQLQKWGESSLVAAIHLYHGGFTQFRGEFGEQPTRYPHGSWEDLTFTLERAQEFLNAHPEYETLPSGEKLNRYPKGPMLGNAISEFHGGFPAFRETLAAFLKGRGEEVKTESLLEEWVNE